MIPTRIDKPTKQPIEKPLLSTKRGLSLDDLPDIDGIIKRRKILNKYQQSVFMTKQPIRDSFCEYIKKVQRRCDQMTQDAYGSFSSAGSVLQNRFPLATSQINNLPFGSPSSASINQILNQAYSSPSKFQENDSTSNSAVFVNPKYSTLIKFNQVSGSFDITPNVKDLLTNKILTKSTRPKLQPFESKENNMMGQSRNIFGQQTQNIMGNNSSSKQALFEFNPFGKTEMMTQQTSSFRQFLTSEHEQPIKEFSFFGNISDKSGQEETTNSEFRVLAELNSNFGGLSNFPNQQRQSVKFTNENDQLRMPRNDFQLNDENCPLFATPNPRNSNNNDSTSWKPNFPRLWQD